MRLRTVWISAALATLVTGGARAAEQAGGAPDCEAALRGWVGSRVADLVKTWGEPTERSPWRRSGEKLVWAIDAAGPSSAAAGGPADQPKSATGSPGSPASESRTTYGKTYESSGNRKGWRAAGGQPPAPTPASSYVMWVDAEGIVKKTDCRYPRR